MVDEKVFSIHLSGSARNPVGWFDILSSGWLCFLQAHPPHISLNICTQAQTTVLVSALRLEFMGQWELDNKDANKDSTQQKNLLSVCDGKVFNGCQRGTVHTFWCGVITKMLRSFRPKTRMMIYNVFKYTNVCVNIDCVRLVYWNWKE